MLPRAHPASWQRVLLHALELAHPQLRLHIVVLRKQFPRSFSYQRRNITYHLLKTPGGLRATSLFWLDTILIRRVLRRIQPDVVHAWGTEQGAAMVAARLAYPYIVTVQGLYSWCAEVGEVNAFERLSAWIEARSLPRAPVVTTESTFSASFVRRHFQPRCVEQIEHAPDPVFQQIRRQPVLQPKQFIFIGRLESRKGADVLLRALDVLRGEMDFQLLMVSRPAGKLYDQFKAQLAAQFWDRVRFKQSLTAPEIAGELASTTMMIYPTLVDVSPNTVKEAVVAGVPVVASRVGGIPDYVIPDKNGLLFEPGNVEDCIRAIREACRHPLFGQGKVEPETRERMRRYLSPSEMARKFWEAYQHVLKSGRR